MNEQECLSKMVAPAGKRPSKPYRGGVIQIWTTRSCDLSCYGCTQGSNLAAPLEAITPDQFEKACLSLQTYWGVSGVFGGNPATHKQFDILCEIMRGIIPFEQRGLWCNNPLGWGKVMRQTFNPAVSNLNVHLNRKAYEEFKRDWPECKPVGLEQDSRHSPPFVAIKDILRKPCDCGNTPHEMTDLGEAIIDGPFISDGPIDCHKCRGTGWMYDESTAWELISHCDINQHWSAMIGVFRGELRSWFCEVAGAQAMLHQYEPDYPDTGISPIRLYDDGDKYWWQLPMHSFTTQVRKHCHECSIPLRGYGELAQSPNPESREQTSETHAGIYHPKRKGRRVELVTVPSQLGNPLDRVTSYLQNASR